MSRLFRVSLGIALTMVLLGGTAWTMALGQLSGESDVRVWIDQPMDESIVVTSSVAITAHVTHRTGVSESRVDVDGSTVATVPLDGEPLELVEFDWVPSTNGTHLIEVYGSSGDGWGTPASVVVTVQIDGLPDDTTTTIAETTTTVGVTTTPTSTPTTSPTTSPTTTPTTVPTTTCTFGVPSLTSPVENADFNIGGAVATPVPFTWGYSGCTPGDLLFQIQLANDPSFAGGTVIWTTNTASTNATSVPITCGDYWWRVRVRAPVVSNWSGVNAFTVSNCQ